MTTIILPAYNEELILKKNILKVLDFCREKLDDDWQIIISDNNSTDRTREIAKKLDSQNSEVKYFFTKKKGKGYGVIEAWQHFHSDIYIFMDVDLATDLKSLPQLIEQIEKGADISVGSRYIQGAEIKRSGERNFISNILHFILKLNFGLKVSDTPCGFKAVNERVVREIVPLIKNRSWFFDTELLVLAEKKKFNIKEVPVVWTDDRETKRVSKVNIFLVIFEYLKNIFSLYGRIKKL